MNKLNNVLVSLITVFMLDAYAQPVYSNTGRKVVVVTEKKYISPEHIKGLDTYDHTVDYFRKEEYILKFQGVYGYFNVNKQLFKDSWLGREFTIEDNQLYYCRPAIDSCDSSK